ncbi:MAG: S-layer homology domain-containing protein, partial [Oscillospiraceae bacterium]
DIKTGGASGTSVATYPKNITAGVDTLTETVTGLTNGTAYTITVQAFNNVGAGAVSNSINATPSGGGGSGSVGGGGGATPSESIELKQPKTDPVTGNTNVEIAAKPETKGDTSTAVIPDKVMTDAISSVVKEAAKTGGTSSVEIVIDAPKDAKTVEAELTRTIIRAVAESEVGSLKITSPVAIITFDTQALATIAAEAAEEKVIISAVSVPEKKLDAAQKALVGDAPVYELKVMSGNKIISDFKGGTATITIPYELKAGEKAEFVTVWYLDDAGKLSPIQGKYEDGFVTFTVGHFSRYAIGYLPFTDVKADWAYESIVYAYQNKLLSGVGNEKFAPVDNMTRAMLWTVLYRAAGSPAKTDNANWYADAQAWAMAEKISDGTNPTGNVTRQELATILYRHAKSTAVQADISGFSDMAEVAEWAADGMNWAVANGILKGIGDKLNPAGNATRAQVATMLQRYLTK